MNQPSELTRAMLSEAAKASPPLTVAALTLNEWVAVATIIYIALQAAYLIWKWRQGARAKRGDA